MESDAVVDDNGGNEASKEKQKWTDKVYTRKSFKGLKNNTNSTQLHTEALASEDANSSQQQTVVPGSIPDVSTGNVAVKLGVQHNQVSINLSSRSKQEKKDLRTKLQGELDLVRDLVKKIDSKVGVTVAVEKGPLRWVRSESPVQESRPSHQLSISVLENSDNVEKEKRTPKANQFYRNSNFLLAKDKFPLAEGNKKGKSGKKETDGFGLGKFSNQAYKSCNTLLDRLMKHKHSWVFNTPVDANALGLHDYFTIIKNPMDLGTVKSRLSKNWYKSPREFAEDVRLTFDNAMTYNPKGQDVHVMAEQLSKIFEEKWLVIETAYMHELRLAVDFDANLATPASRKTATPRLPPHGINQVNPFGSRPKKGNLGRVAAPKKPKAKDANKRDMTYQEKQKLSIDLQSLPSEKLNDIVQIIKKRNKSLSQHDDEIEVDIDSFDTETLWELHRFVTNSKKSLSKNRRKSEMAIKKTTVDVHNVPEKQNLAPIVVEVDVSKETKKDEKVTSVSIPDQLEKQAGDASGSSSSSGFSGDSGSSSSDSDTVSSSGNEPDAARLPQT